MKTIARFPLMFAVLALGACAFGQTRIGAKGYPNKLGVPKVGLSSQDKKFLMDAAAGNQFEIQSSMVALKNGSSPFVKEFAKEMIADHGAAFEELKLVDKKKGMMASKKLPAPKQAIVDKLSGLKGAAFDAAYIKAQKAAHAETAMKFEKQIKAGHDADAKDYAVKTLPAVKMHQQMLVTKKTMMGKTKM